jgi:hypothetical protein
VFRKTILNDDKTRLLSPIHRGALSGGRSFVEADCNHRSTTSRFKLGVDCSNGVYYYRRPSATRLIELLDEGANWTDQAHVAVSFGCAVGDVYPDPVIPDIASRTARYRMLALILPERSDTAGELRQRYGVNVHMGRPITMDTLDDVESAVRSELRNEKPGKGFFTALRKEPLWASDTHICDTDQAGWRLWGLTSRYRLASPLMRDERTFNTTMFRARPMLREKPSAAGFVSKPRARTPTANYRRNRNASAAFTTHWPSNTSAIGRPTSWSNPGARPPATKRTCTR